MIEEGWTRKAFNTREGLCIVQAIARSLCCHKIGILSRGLRGMENVF